MHFAAEMFCQVTVNPEGNHAVSALKWPGVISGGSPKCGVDVDFVEVTHRPLVFLQMALGAEAHGTGVTTERPLKVVDVDVEPELMCSVIDLMSVVSILAVSSFGAEDLVLLDLFIIECLKLCHRHEESEMMKKADLKMVSHNQIVPFFKSQSARDVTETATFWEEY